MKQKTKLLIVVIVALVIVLYPVRYRLTDGGTVTYQAISYTVSIRNTMAEEWETR